MTRRRVRADPRDFELRTIGKGYHSRCTTTCRRITLRRYRRLALGNYEYHKHRQNTERLDAGRAWHDTDLVFCRRNGYPLNGSVVTHHFQRLLEQAGLPKRRFHDLRHSCATLLLAQGVSPRVVMEVLGHSQISLTMNTYAHVLPEMRRDAADRM